MTTHIPNAKQQFIDGNGKPYAGGSVGMYIPNTTTPKNTWQDPNQTTLNTNPIILDAAGEAVIYGVGQYRQILKDVNGNTIWDQLTEEPVFAFPGGTTYTSAGAGAVSRTFVAKMSDWMSAKDFGCQGDGVTDDTVNMQAAFTAANAQGKKLFITSGKYILSSSIVINNSAQTTFPTNRFSILGEDPQNTVLSFTNAAANGISITGSTTGVAATSLQTIGGLTIQQASRAGVGLNLVSLAHVNVYDMYISGFNIGLQETDVQESIHSNVDAQWNNGGFYCAKGTFSQPNALMFNNCTFGNNANYGIDAQNVSTFTYIGGSIESNNDSVGAFASIWGCRINIAVATTEGTAAALFLGTYIENNGSATVGKGIADIWYQNNSQTSTLTLIGCSFQRHAQFCTNNVQISTSGGFKHKVSLLGNGHRGFSDYTASATRPYVQNYSATDPVQLVDLGCIYDSALEAPNYSGSVAMPPSPVSQISNPVAWVVFNGTNGTIVQSFNVASVTRSGVGNYTVNYARTVQGNINCIAITVGGGAGVGYVNSQNTAGAGILTINMSGTGTDFAQIYCVVLGGNLT